MSQLRTTKMYEQPQFQAFVYHDEVFIPEPATKQQHYDKLENMSNGTSNSKRPANEQDLFKAIECLRKRLPNRSLEQIIIRLRQTVQYKKTVEGSDKNFDNVSVNSRANDFDDRSEIDFKDGHYFDMNGSNQGGTSAKGGSVYDQNFSKSYKYTLNQPESQVGELNLGINYIYKPKGPEVVVEYKEADILKTNFINAEEEVYYRDRRVMAKSFVQRGYGTEQCRLEIKALGVPMVLKRNTYKSLSSSVIILAFRKLESFIANECGKTIKFLDRWQMSSLRTPLLNCRSNLEPEQYQTLFKYIRASYGLGDVRIGEVESVKLYLACQKFIYGSNVSMQMMERMGQVQNKKCIELTLEYLNRKKKKREERLLQLRGQYAKRPWRNRNANSDMQQEQIKVQGNVSNSSKVKIEQTVTNTEKQPQMSKRSHKKQKQHSPTNGSEAIKKNMKDQVKRQEYSWTEEMDIAMIRYLLEGVHISQVLQLLKQQFSILQDMPQKYLIKQYLKLLKKAIAKVQYQTQLLANDPTNKIRVVVLSRLNKPQLKQVIEDPKGNQVRLMLLSYYMYQEQDLVALRRVAQSVLDLLEIKEEEELPDDIFHLVQSIDASDITEGSGEMNESEMQE